MDSQQTSDQSQSLWHCYHSSNLSTFDLWESIQCGHLSTSWDRAKGQEDEKTEDWLHSVEIFLSRFKFSWLRLSSCQGKVALELIWNPTSTSQKQNVSLIINPTFKSSTRMSNNSKSFSSIQPKSNHLLPFWHQIETRYQIQSNIIKV